MYEPYRCLDALNGLPHPPITSGGPRFILSQNGPEFVKYIWGKKPYFMIGNRPNMT